MVDHRHAQCQTSKLKELAQKADAHFTVTVAMLKKSCKLTHSAKCIADALHKEGIYFRRVLEKPFLTAVDVKARLAARRKMHQKRNIGGVHAAIDDKHFEANLAGGGLSPHRPKNHVWGLKMATAKYSWHQSSAEWALEWQSRG